MKDIVLPRFLKIRDPQTNSIECEGDFIKVIVEGYNVTDDSNLVMKLRCNGSIYDSFDFCYIKDENRSIPCSVMSWYFRTEISRVLSGFTKMSLMITDMYSPVKVSKNSYLTISDPIVIVAQLFENENDINDRMFVQYGKSNDLLPSNSRSILSEDFHYKRCTTRSFLNNGSNDVEEIERYGIYDYGIIKYKVNETLHSAAHIIEINYNNLNRITQDKWNRMTGVRVDNDTATNSVRLGAITLLLNVFLVYATFPKLYIGMASEGKRIKPINPIAVASDGAHCWIVIYNKPNFILDDVKLNPTFDLIYNNTKGTYEVKLDISNVFRREVDAVSKAIIERYWDDIRKLPGVDEDYQYLEEGESNEILTAALRLIDKHETEIISSELDDDISPMFSTHHSIDWDDMNSDNYIILTRLRINLRSSIERCFIMDALDCYVQYQFDIDDEPETIPLNSFNISVALNSWVKDGELPRLFGDNGYGLANVVIDDIQDAVTTEYKDDGGVVHAIKRDITSLNKAFTDVMGQLIMNVPCKLSHSRVYIYKNGSFMITDYASMVKEEIDIQRAAAEYDLIMASIYNMNTCRRYITPQTIKSSLFMDACLTPPSAKSVYPRRLIPIAYVIIGGYNKR